MNCYIKFCVPDDACFQDLKVAFNAFKSAKNNQEPQSDKFWLNVFPDYALRRFSFLEHDVKPSFKTADYDNPFTWHFYSLTELLSVNYEIEYADCFKLSENEGQLEYDPYSYPYGGITGLIIFIKAFKCIPTRIDDGTSLYGIDFLDNGDFSITDLNDPAKQNSANKLFNATKLLWQFATRNNKK